MWPRLNMSLTPCLRGCYGATRGTRGTPPHLSVSGAARSRVWLLTLSLAGGSGGVGSAVRERNVHHKN